MFSSLKQHIAQAKPLHLYIWAIVLLLSASLAFVGSQWLLRYSPASQAFVVFNKDRLVKAGQSPNGTIVMLGDSHVKWGTLPPEQFEQLLASHGINKKVVRITYDFASFNEFQPLVDTIFSINPAAVVIQNDLLSKVRTYKYHESIIRDYTTHYFSSNTPWNPGDADQIEKQDVASCNAMASAEPINNRIKRTAKKTYFKKNGSLQPNAQRFLTTAKEKGIPVILLSIPTTTIAQQKLPKPFIHPQAISPPANLLSDKDFCDTVHLDVTGRDLFSNWLVTLLAKHLNETL